MRIITAGLLTCLLVFAQQEIMPRPTFGTTVVVPGGLVGVVYYIPPNFPSLPFFQQLDPVGVIYTASLNVPTRHFTEGFPGVTNRVAWFAIDYHGRFWIEKPGMYQFALTSDDGSKLYIDDEMVVDNDGWHDTQTKTGRVALSGGIHNIRVSYFQGPPDEIALVLQVAGPGEELRVFSTDEFRPPADPETWEYADADKGGVSAGGRLGLHISSEGASPGEQVTAAVTLDGVLPGREPVGLKWEVVVPAQVLEFTGDGAETGGAVAGSEKSVRCSAQKSYLYSCVLAGDQKPIMSGPVAIFHFKVRREAQPGTTKLRIENAEATTVDRRRSMLGGAEGTIAIHPSGGGS